MSSVLAVTTRLISYVLAREGKIWERTITPSPLSAGLIHMPAEVFPYLITSARNLTKSPGLGHLRLGGALRQIK